MGTAGCRERKRFRPVDRRVNFEREHLDNIIVATGHVPAINQVELHLGFQQRELCGANEKNGIVTAAWSPLARGAVLEDPAIAAVDQEHSKSPAQVILQWHLEKGRVVIPKSNSIDRLREDFEITDFSLDAAQIAIIDQCERWQRTGPDPATHHG